MSLIPNHFVRVQDGPDDFSIRVKLLDSVHSVLHLIALSHLAVGLMFVYINWPVSDHERLLSWYGALILLLAPLLPIKALYFRCKPKTERQYRRWMAAVIAHSFLFGFIWGVGAALFIDFFHLEYAIIDLIITFGMAFGSGLVIRSSPVRAIVFMVPSISGVIYALYPLGTKAVFFGLAGSAMFSYLIIAFMMVDRREFINNIRLSFEVTRLHEKLKKDVTARQKLMTAVGHDLRQPLAVMNMLLATLSSKLTDDEAKQLARRMDVSVKSIDGMLSSLLSAAKLEAGVEPANAPVRLLPLCERLRDEVSVIVQDHGNRFVMQCRDVVVNTDEKMLEGILRNLLINAAKYTTDGEVSLIGRLVNDGEIEGFELAVCDTGQGIGLDKQKRVFEEFAQLDSSDSSYLKGFGLGLSIASRMARLLGFSLNLESTPGAGSCFTLMIPKDRLQVDDLAGDASATSPPPGIEHGASVVVVSADGEMRETLRAMLTRWGCDVALMADCEIPRDLKPNLLILDGLSAPEKGLNVPIITIADSESAASAQPHSLSRPVKPAKLRALIRASLA